MRPSPILFRLQAGIRCLLPSLALRVACSSLAFAAMAGHAQAPTKSEDAPAAAMPPAALLAPPPGLPDPAAPPPAGPAQAGRAPAPPPAGNAIETVNRTTSIQRWLINPNGDVDGMILADGTQATLPPHLSARVLQIARIGEPVALSGWREGTVLAVREVRNVASGSRVADHGPDGPPGPLPATGLQPMAVSSRIDMLLRGPRGEVNGALLHSGDVVRFPPPAAQAFDALLQPGRKLYARGFGTRNAQGSAFEATALGTDETDVRQIFVRQ